MPRTRKNNSPNGNGKTFTTQQSLDSAVWNICNILRRSNCAGALQYVPELTWILFLHILDEREAQEAEDCRAVGAPFTPSLQPPYRWQDWAAPGGRCGIVLDEGVLFRTNETVFVQVKRKLLNEFIVWCIISLPGGVFSAAGAGVKANLVFFAKGEPTERIWYYDLSDLKVGKKNPFTVKALEEFFRLLPDRADSDHSWTMDVAARRAAARREADALRAQAGKPAAAAARLREQIKELEKAGEPDADQIAALKAQAKQHEAEARDLNARAQAVEDAVYDFKPSTRTPRTM